MTTFMQLSMSIACAMAASASATLKRWVTKSRSGKMSWNFSRSFRLDDVAGRGMIAHADHPHLPRRDVVRVEDDVADIGEDAGDDVHAAAADHLDALRDRLGDAGAFEREVGAAALGQVADPRDDLLGREAGDVDRVVGAEALGDRRGDSRSGRGR